MCSSDTSLDRVKKSSLNSFQFLSYSVFKHCTYNFGTPCSFEVISYPFLDGNVPKGPSYGILISQLVRLARINSSYSSFISDCKFLVRKLINQHFDPAALRKRFEMFVDKYFDIWGKFGKFLTADEVFQL